MLILIAQGGTKRVEPVSKVTSRVTSTIRAPYSLAATLLSVQWSYLAGNPRLRVQKEVPKQPGSPIHLRSPLGSEFFQMS